MLTRNDFNRPVNREKLKDITVGGNSNSNFYCIFRIGKKLKVVDGNMKATLNTVKAFQKHMERQQETLNADKTKENEILIGNKNIYGNVKEYIKEVNIHKNNVLGRELLMTASPDFFRGMMPGELEKWKDDNIKFLEKTFGDTCRYACLHLDESTPHIHALIVPKIKNKRNEYILSNKHYFNGIEAYREFQDNYSKSMQEHFKCLKRGVKYSKAKHLTIRQYYNLVNKELDHNNIKQIEAKAKDHELQEIKIKAIERTLQVYKNYNSKNSLALEESKELIKYFDSMKKKESKFIYKEVLSVLSSKYKVPQYLIDQAIKECDQINDKENEKE